MLKECVKEGTPKPTQHKHQIEKLENLEKLSTFFKDALNNQIILRWSVYFNLETHFLSWGQKFYHQLKLNSFAFHIDENDQYAICKIYMIWYGYRYMPSENVKITNSENWWIRHLFNKYTNDAMSLPKSTSIWFINAPLQNRTFSNF